MTGEDLEKPTIIGRSSSHFTRVAKIFAAELGVDCSFQVVRDLMSSDPADYGGNPALKLPSLHTPRGTWFGSLNICRELARRSSLGNRVVWPEDLEQPVSANAQELVVQAMATEVTLIMAKVAGDSPERHSKTRASLVNSIAWLEGNAKRALSTLPPDRHLSFLEVTLFCLVTHLEFRDVLSIAPYPELRDFCSSFGARPSAEGTAYRFDS